MVICQGECDYMRALVGVWVAGECGYGVTPLVPISS